MAASSPPAPSPKPRKEKVVIVMPAYNAAKTLEDTFRAIPPGYYVPAETADSLHGAWVRVVDSRDTYFASPEGPTFPVPDRVPLQGASGPVSLRAYRGALTIPIPVWTPPGVTGHQVLSIEFGFQLCDVRECRSFSTTQAQTDVMVAEPEIPKDYLTRMKMAYLDEGPSPSHRWYGWVTA